MTVSFDIASSNRVVGRAPLPFLFESSIFAAVRMPDRMLSGLGGAAHDVDVDGDDRCQAAPLMNTTVKDSV